MSRRGEEIKAADELRRELFEEGWERNEDAIPDCRQWCWDCACEARSLALVSNGEKRKNWNKISHRFLEVVVIFDVKSIFELRKDMEEQLTGSVLISISSESWREVQVEQLRQRMIEIANWAIEYKKMGREVDKAILKMHNLEKYLGDMIELDGK